MNKVPWLTRLEISQETNHLLDRWSAFIGQKVKPPVPVEAIAENYLGIAVEYDNLEEMLGISDVLGATWVESKTMVINSSLLDGAEGRISFTCSHEIGHWVLHRKYFFRTFFPKGPLGSRYISNGCLSDFNLQIERRMAGRLLRRLSAHAFQ